MGHNPAGNLVTHPASKYSIRAATEGLTDEAKGLCNKDGSPQFNRVVRPLIEALGQNPDQTFVTNALFVRSLDAAALASEEDAIFEACWPVHQWFLSIVRPRLILCLGYTQDPKKRMPFRRILEKMDAPHLTPIETTGKRFGAWASGYLPISECQSLPVAVAAVYHPSARQGASWSSERLGLFKSQIAPQLRSKLA
jgi:hypothetical protein